MPGGLTWWHTLGSATLTVFIVQVVTGIVLAMYYSPSPDHAYDSIRYLERTVVSGALLRGIHHWGASAMVVLVLAHMIRVFTHGRVQVPARDQLGARRRAAVHRARLQLHRLPAAVGSEGVLGDAGRNEHRRHDAGRRRDAREDPARRRAARRGDAGALLRAARAAAAAAAR